MNEKVEVLEITGNIYVDLTDIIDFYKIPKLDENQLEKSQVYLVLANERINLISGNKIEDLGFDNLTAFQQNNIKKAVGRYFIWLIDVGQTWFNQNVSYSTDGVSISQTGVEEPDYILQSIYDYLQNANLYQQRDIFKSCPPNDNDGAPINSFYQNPNFNECDYALSARLAYQRFVGLDNLSVQNLILEKGTNETGQVTWHLIAQVPQSYQKRIKDLETQLKEIKLLLNQK